MKGSPKALYSYIRRKQKVNISVGQLRKPDGNMSENDGDTAEVLGEFFKLVFVEEDDTSIPRFDPRVENR